MYAIKPIAPHEVSRIYHFRDGLKKQSDGNHSLNDSLTPYLAKFPLRYAAQLKLVHAAVLPSDELLGYITGYPPAAALALGTTIKTVDSFERKSLTTFKRCYIELQRLFREDYFLIASASFKHDVDQKNIFSSLLDKFIEESKRQQFSGIVMCAARTGLQRFLPFADFNLIETVRFKESEPFLNVYYRAAI